MRGRSALLIALPVLVALVGGYVLWPRNTPEAVGGPTTAAPSDPSVRSTNHRPPGSTPHRSSSPGTTPPKTTPPRKVCSSPADSVVYAGGSGAGKAGEPQSEAEGLRFGPLDPEGEYRHFTVAVSDDRRALTSGFDDFLLEVDARSTGCVATRSFAMTLPLTGSGDGTRLSVYAQGYCFLERGTSARITMRANGQVSVRNFRAGADDSYLQELHLPATPGATYRLSVVIEVRQNPGSKRSAHLGVSSLDSEIT